MPVDEPVTLVIPAYDEAERIGRTLATLVGWLDDDAVPGLARVVVCDDGSSDGTAALVAEVAGRDPRVELSTAPHRGKGAALRRGCGLATTELVAFLDADLPVPSRSLAALIAAAAEVDVVVGTRRRPGSTPVRAQPAVRRWGGRAFLLGVAALGYRSVSDPQCGAKVIRRSSTADLVAACRSDGYAFDLELLDSATAAGRRVTEVPVEWIHVGGSTVRPVRDAVTTLANLAVLRTRRRRQTNG